MAVHPWSPRRAVARPGARPFPTAGRVLAICVAAGATLLGPAARPGLAAETAAGPPAPTGVESDAPPPHAATAALVVGTNRGGPGQTDLRFAEDDARTVAEVLHSPGRYERDAVELLLRPTRRELERALDQLAARTRAAHERGAATQAVFYYSGHARANALNLGDEELSLAELRARLGALPSAVTIVVLDACQSGAVSRVKGAEATADFSYNSVSHLDMTGIAVMASSTATELSQESEVLRSSYFTHHLLVGLRGAGDTDADGRVTLAEAYRYAYNQTLAATAATAVGSQHATLETGLRGKGEVVLSYPAAARTRLALPAALRAEVLVRQQNAGTVMAELHKAEGHELVLALPAGQYEAIVRQGHHVRRCTLALADGSAQPLEPGGCPVVEPTLVAVKGAGPAPISARERWAFYAAVGAARARDDRFIERLSDFGFADSIYFGIPRLSLGVTRSLRRHVALGLELATLDERAFKRHSTTTLSGQDERFWWSTAALAAVAILDWPVWHDRLIPYARGGVGLTYARTSFQTSDATTQALLGDAGESDFGWLLRAAAGLAVMPWTHVGVYLEATVTYAPTVGNLLGDVHDSGGPGALLGLRGAL